jgi:hypothetical protein
MTQQITPRYKLMLFYDPPPGDKEEYYNFVMNEMIPAVQEHGLYMFRVFYTLWGDYPERQAEFIAEDLATIQAVLESDLWQTLEAKLLHFTSNYHRKVVKFKPGFQF